MNDIETPPRLRTLVEHYAYGADIAPPRLRMGEMRSVAGIERDRAGGFVVLLDSRLADAPSRVVSAVVAHEIGHIALGHHEPMGRFERAALATWAAAVSATMVGFFPPVPSGGGLAFALGSLLLCVVGGIAAIVVSGHRREYAADAYAARAGAPLDAVVVAWLASVAPGRPWFLLTHPSWSARAGRVRSLGADQMSGPSRR